MSLLEKVNANVQMKQEEIRLQKEKRNEKKVSQMTLLLKDKTVKEAARKLNKVYSVNKTLELLNTYLEEENMLPIRESGSIQKIGLISLKKLLPSKKGSTSKTTTNTESK